MFHRHRIRILHKICTIYYLKQQGMASCSTFASSSLRDLSSDRDHFLTSIPSLANAIPKLDFYRPGEHVPLPSYSQNRWETIKAALNNIATAGPSLTFPFFVEQIHSYASFELDFSALEALIDSGWYSGRVLSEILPSIARLTLELPTQIRGPIRLLLTHQNGSLTFSQRQAAILLANAFYCTFKPNSLDRQRFPRFNFHYLFRLGKIRIEKLKFLLNYFAQISMSMPGGTLSIIRQRREQLPEGWKDISLDAPLTPLPDGRIEDEGAEHTQLDFANAFMGGGVLGNGSVQEEIRFLICPELIVSCLICERMEDDEAILLLGAERFSDYSGYGDTLRWRRREQPGGSDTARDIMGRALRTELVAIDALAYRGRKAAELYQFSEQAIRREMLKAFAGFSLRTPHSPHGLATGNWGCGAFGGEIELKSLIQWMASSLVPGGPRPLFYFTFGNASFADDLSQLAFFLRSRHVTIGQLFDIILDYGQALGAGIVVAKKRGGEGLFQWIRDLIGQNQNELDEKRPYGTGPPLYQSTSKPTNFRTQKEEEED